MQRIFAALFVLTLVGCGSADHPRHGSQRFVLVPDPSGINKNIPAGALVLDTTTGQLCYSVGGSYTSELPAIDMCSALLQSNP